MKKSALSTIVILAIAISYITARHTDSASDNGKETEQTSVSTEQKETEGKDGLEIPALTYQRGVELEYTGYTTSYNFEHNCPNWSAWKLTKKRTEGTIPRCTKFYTYEDLPKANCVDYYDYKDSGYDRGHMCPAGDMKWDADAMHDCFYMTNMCPQNPSLNSGSWKRLEEACRSWARTEGTIYIVCGPVFKENTRHEKIGINHAIDVPEGFFKAVLSVRKGHEKAIAFYYSNTSEKQPMSATATSVDEIEKLINLDLFYTLDYELQKRVESTYNLSDWK